MSLVMDIKTRAELRRVDPWEVRGAYRWVRTIKTFDEFREVTEAQLMAITPLIAQVREDSSKTLGQALRGSNQARVRRLLASDREDILDQLSKAVRLVNRSVSIADLAATAVFWGENRRRQLARDYFSVEEVSQSA